MNRSETRDSFSSFLCYELYSVRSARDRARFSTSGVRGLIAFLSEDILLVFGGDESLELFEPVEDDVDAPGRDASTVLIVAKSGRCFRANPSFGSSKRVTVTAKTSMLHWDEPNRGGEVFGRLFRLQDEKRCAGYFGPRHDSGRTETL